MKKAESKYEFPDTLQPLMRWLAHRHVDVFALKTDRQVLWMAKELSGQKTIPFPAKGQSCSPALHRLQKIICSPRVLEMNRVEIARVQKARAQTQEQKDRVEKYRNARILEGR